MFTKIPVLGKIQKKRECTVKMKSGISLYFFLKKHFSLFTDVLKVKYPEILVKWKCAHFISGFQLFSRLQNTLYKIHNLEILFTKIPIHNFLDYIWNKTHRTVLGCTWICLGAKHIYGGWEERDNYKKGIQYFEDPWLLTQRLLPL